MPLSSNPRSYGYVTVATAGVPVALSSILTDLEEDPNIPGQVLPTEKLEGLCLQLLETGIGSAPGTGTVFVGLTGMNTTTGAGVLAVLSPNGKRELVLHAEFWNKFDPWSLEIDTDTNGEGVLLWAWQR